MVLDAPYPPDIRVRKEAASLVNAGHDVTLLCICEQGQPQREMIDSIDVVRLSLENAYSGSDVFSGPYYLLSQISPFWKRAIDEVYRSDPFDALHVHDLPLVKTALNWASDRQVRVIADLHENWPEAKRQYRKNESLIEAMSSPKEFLFRLSTPISRLKRLESECVNRADRLITVAEEAKQHYVADCGVDPRKVSVVPNFVDRAEFTDADSASVDFDAEFIISYVGTIGGEYRGLETVLRAMPSIAEAVPDPLFVIVGSGPHKATLQREVENLGIEEITEFTGWVDFEEVPSYVGASDVCLVPHRTNPHTATTIPHKLFQYMGIGKPVIVTDSPPLQRTVADVEAGVVVPSGDSTAMADAAIDLYENPEYAIQLGENGQQTVESTYNWGTAGETLCDLYRNLGSSAV